MWAHGYQRFDVDEAAEAEWFGHVKEMYEGVVKKAALTGYNSNIEGHEHGKMRYNIYNGGGPRYARMLQEAAENDYAGMYFQ